MMPATTLPLRRIQAIAKDPVKCAKAVDLIYVSDSDPGITRVKKGKGFVYMLDNKKISDASVLQRIRSIVIPPAWRNVWISRYHNGHIQATGLDAMNRKQYRYHADWNNLRNQAKFSRLLHFGEKLPQLRLQLERDFASKELTETKVLATVISLMERTYIRIGNNGYEKLYGSYGLTTFKDRHVKINGDQMRFSFKGKKGIYHQVTLRNRRLARAVKQCREIPGSELFQYYDEHNNRCTIDSGKVNAYIKTITGEDFTAKDFRTWAGTLNALDGFRMVGEVTSEGEKKRKLNEVLEMVSCKLGNTKTVCRKYYVHPFIIDLYEKQGLGGYLSQLDAIEAYDEKSGLTAKEKVLLEILRKQ